MFYRIHDDNYGKLDHDTRQAKCVFVEPDLNMLTGE